MEPFTLDRNFHRQSVVDGFNSIIWTERYYGDGSVQLVVPDTLEMQKKIPEGIFLGVEGTKEVMIIETRTFEDGKMTCNGISLVEWLNNRFIRATASHEDRYWYLSGLTPGAMLWYIVQQMCVAGSPFLNGTNPTGIDDAADLAIPGLALLSYDDSGDDIAVGVPYGPVYDALKELATTYKVGLQITLELVTDTGFTLGFRSYRGQDRTSLQTTNQLVRFSPRTDTLSDVKEVQSISAYKTKAYVFAPGFPEGIASIPGKSTVVGPPLTGFDLKAMQVFADDLTTDQLDSDESALVDVLNSRANDALTNNKWIKAVDGEITADNQYTYKVDYFLGDVVEVQGNTSSLQAARVTEYIRTQDATGYREYPTLETEGEIVTTPLVTTSGIFVAGVE